jgi:hypothetical protein
MASESLRPTPASSGGGYAKYLIGLLLLLGGGLGAFLATRKPEQPPAPAATPPPPKNAERSTALAQEAVQLPVEEPEDAGAPVVAEPVKKPKKGGGGGNDQWSCAGDIPTGDIKQLLADRQPAIRACYEKRLRVNNMLQGNLRLQLRIGNDGKVQAARASGSLRDPEVFNCVQTLSKKWSFPAPSGGSCAVIEAPYNFTPKP